MPFNYTDPNLQQVKVAEGNAGVFEREIKYTPKQLHIQEAALAHRNINLCL